MPRSAAVSIENTASKGLITEATGLNFPENAWTDALNVTPDNKGVTSRRLGINYEDGASTFHVTRSSSTINTGTWINVGGNGDLNFTVVQVGSTLYFYEQVTGEALSVNKKTFTVDLSTLAITGSPSTSAESCEFASGNGYLFVTHPYCDPFYLTYDASGDSITVNTITVKIRDFEGVDDDLMVRERPLVLSDEHRYNLYNQGWFKKAYRSSAFFPIDDGAAGFFIKIGLYPSNSDILWLYKRASDDIIVFESSVYTDVVGQAQAPRGYFILDAFNQDRTSVVTSLNDESNTVPTVDVVTSSYFRPRATAFFAGRVWYAGTNYGEFSNKIYFSQIVETPQQIGYCYQNQDPTSETFSDLLATDGGVVSILEAGTIYKLFATQKAILVFASNGVWSISGTETTPFKATEYSVVKVSGLSTKSGNSFVDVQGYPAWWNDEGIYVVTSDDIGNFKVDSLTDTTIKTFYNNIPSLSKKYSRGSYDSIDKVIQWVYSANPAATGDLLYNYDRFLCFNVLTGAFYPWSYDTSQSIFINGIVTANSNTVGAMASSENVVDSNGVTVTDSLGAAVTIVTTLVAETVYDSSGAAVTDSNGDIVTALVSTGNNANFNHKYFTTRQFGGTNYEMTFSEEYDNANRDWRIIGSGTSYSSFYRSGYKLHTDAQRFGQTNYIVVYANNVTDASAFIKVIWDYEKITGAVNQIYRNNLTIPITQTKIMLRGRGRAFQFEVTSDDDAPFETIGWSVFETQNSSI